MKLHHFSTILTLAVVPIVSASTIAIDLGAAKSFAVLAGSTVTNTGPSTIHGDLGVSPGSAVTGFPPGVVTGGTIHAADAVAAQAKSDLLTAYDAAAGAACNTDLSGQDLGGKTLLPGVYCFTSSAQLTGALALNSLGDPNSSFLFQIGSTLTTASNASVTFTNGGQGYHVYWKVGSSATLGTNTAFAGNILALGSITLDTAANIPCGRALAINGAVTLDTNPISVNTPGCEATGATTSSPVPEPAALHLFAAGLIAITLSSWRLSAPLPRAR